jgi:hypothetical protein
MSKDKSDKSWFGRHKVLTVIGALIGLVIVGSIIGGGSKNSTQTTANNKDSSKPSPSTAQLAKIGAPANDGKFQFTFNSIQCNQPTVGSDQYTTKAAQGQYCVVNLTAKNIGNESQTLDATSQYLYDAQNHKYSADTEASIDANPSGGTFYNSINPGNSVTGVVVFDIPKGVTPVTGELHDSAFSGGVKVSLQ